MQTSPSVGHEFQGVRPAVVVQALDLPGDDERGLVTLIPLTSFKGKRWKHDLKIEPNPSGNRLQRTSLVKLQHIRSVDTRRFIRWIGTMEDETMAKIRAFLRSYFSL